MAPVGRLPIGRTIELPDRGSTYVIDSGPRTAGPTFVLLHSIACTGLLTWYPSLEALREFGRVLVFDQRGHGQGIVSSRFLLEDCADDVASLADELGIETFVPIGFSMGSLVAQLVWQRHRTRVDGLVLCAVAATFGRALHERLATGLFAALLDTLSPQAAAPAAAAEIGNIVRHNSQWAVGQFRSTSPWVTTRALAELVRFNSTSWISDIDVPTSVVVPMRDRCISPRHQQWVARQIPDAHMVPVDGGHACCTLQSEKFVPALREAVDSVVDRITASRRATPSARQRNRRPDPRGRAVAQGTR